MTELQGDSFDVAALGRQHNSQKDTMPSYSFGTGVRGASSKVFISKRHEKRKAVMNSPGPVYGIPSTVGQGPKYGFGTEENRIQKKPEYPDSSVDLTCSLVDSQMLKFSSTKGVHFGTEPRMNSKNAEPIQDNPTSNLCTQSPPNFDYNPVYDVIAKSMPEYSFGPKENKPGEKCATRSIHMTATGTPRRVGPGSHSQPAGTGPQPSSARKSAPSWSFGGRKASQSNAPQNRPFPSLDPQSELSSLGKQVVSSARTAPSAGFGTSTREHSARTFLIVTEADRGPAAAMPPARFHLEMPPQVKHLPTPGL